MTTTVEITLPIAVEARDYHAFPALESTMRAIGIKGGKCLIASEAYPEVSLTF